MTNQEFEIELERAILRSKKILTEALIGMATKHITSIADMVKNPEEYNLRKWNEKITALRNYTFLLDALIRDMGII